MSLEEQKKVLGFRTNNILNSLLSQNSGADIHTVNNLRNRATLLLDILRCPDGDCGIVAKNLKRLEADVVDFFRKKYSSLL